MTSAYLEAISDIRQRDIRGDRRGEWPSDRLTPEDFEHLRDALARFDHRSKDADDLIGAWSRPFLLCVAALTVAPPRRAAGGRAGDDSNH